MATQEGAEGSGEGPSDLGRPLDRSEEDARDAAVLRDTLRDPALVAYLEQQMQSELLRRGDEDEIARRMLAEQWRDEQLLHFFNVETKRSKTTSLPWQVGAPRAIRTFLNRPFRPPTSKCFGSSDPRARLGHNPYISQPPPLSSRTSNL